MGVFCKGIYNQFVHRCSLLARVDLDAFVLTLEQLDNWKCLFLKRVEPELNAVNIIIASAGVLRTSENASLEYVVGALEVQHFRKLCVSAERLVPAFQVRQRPRKSVE